MDNQEQLQQQLVALKQSYAAKLASELASLNTLANTLLDSQEIESVLSELHQKLHKLAGSGGTFGFPQLSQAARELETQVQALLHTQDGVNKPVLDDLVSRVAALHEHAKSVNQPETMEKPACVPPSLSETRTIHLLATQVETANDLKKELVNFGYSVASFLTYTAHLNELKQGKIPEAIVIDTDFSADVADYFAHGRELFQGEIPSEFIFISNRDDFRAQIMAARVGAQGYFKKPVDIPKLVDRLERTFNQRDVAPYRVMIVDDDIDLACHYQLVLQRAGMEVGVVTEPTELFAAADELRPELILMDIHMPGYSGTELARMLRMRDEWLGVPIVYLSAETDLQMHIKAMLNGGDDFLTKPIADNYLIAAVTARVARARQLNNLISRDSMTGLLKHVNFKEQLVTELERSRRTQEPLVVAMFDIDHFKKVNDTYGHGMGDRVIKALAHLLKQRLRKTDIVARYGGEEFAAVLLNCTVEAACDILNDIREKFAAIPFMHDESSFSCTLSSGMATNTEYPDFSILEAADGALYDAKRSGRNKVCVALRKEETV